MNIKQELTTLLQNATGLKVYWATTPAGFVAPPAGFLIGQGMGGEREWYVDRDTPKSHDHARVQIRSYAKSRVACDALAAQVEDAIRLSTLIANPYGAPVDDYEDALGMHVSTQQFGFQVPK